jgi:hypothetical protein
MRPDRRHALAILSKIALDRQRPLALSNDDEKAFQLSTASQIPTLVWSGQLSDRFVGQQKSNVSHSRRCRRAKTVFKRF